jgi:hypothetical protein
MSFSPDYARKVGPIHEVARRGFLIVARHGDSLPPRCVLCSQPVDTPLIARRFAWHDPMLYLVLFAAPLLYPLVRLFIVRRATLHLALCPDHRSSQQLHMASRIGLALVGFILIVVGFVLLVALHAEIIYWILFAIGYGLLLLAAFYKQTFGLLRPFEIRDGEIKLQGADPRFLKSLPDISPPTTRAPTVTQP